MECKSRAGPCRQDAEGLQLAVSYISVGCALVTFDGSPLQPMSALWTIVDEFRVTGLGISLVKHLYATDLYSDRLDSPRYLQTLLAAGYYPTKHHSLKSLKSVLTAGAPGSFRSDCRQAVY